MTTRLSSRDLIELLLDDGRWQSWDTEPVELAEPGSEYADQLAAHASAPAPTSPWSPAGEPSRAGRWP